MKRRILPILHSLRHIATLVFVLIFAANQWAFVVASADVPPPADQDAIHQWPLWNPSVTGTCGSNSSVTLTGSDPEEKVWNFLLGQGLTKAQAAGIMGNLQQESGFNAGAEQIPGVSWEDMSTRSNDAVGLAQWDGGNRPAMINAAESQGLTLSDLKSGSDKDLAWQLQYFWQQVSGTAPTGKQDVLAGIKAITADSAAGAQEAASYFDTNFEGGTDPGNVRENDATTIYNNPDLGGSTSASTGGACSTGASSCNTQTGQATGVAKIFCESLRFDPASYSESAMGDHMGSNKTWIAQVCPPAGDPTGVITPSCYVDCSGLVNISVYLAFGYDLQENTHSEYSDTNLWQHIPFSQVQQGDLIQPIEYFDEDGVPGPGHVEIINKVVGNTVFTMGAHTSNALQPDQVSQVSMQHESGDVFLHWIGPTN